MAEAVAKVARRINATVEEDKDSLDLSNCQLISFPDGVFKVLRTVSQNIHFITLADNEMKAISSKLFSTFTQLKELDLQGNVITKLPDTVGEMEHLTSINLAKNSFSIFPDKLTEIATLERIDLEGNNITEIPLEKLSVMPALKWLNVKSNPLDSNTQVDALKCLKDDIEVLDDNKMLYKKRKEKKRQACKEDEFPAAASTFGG